MQLPEDMKGFDAVEYENAPLGAFQIVSVKDAGWLLLCVCVVALIFAPVM